MSALPHISAAFERVAERYADRAARRRHLDRFLALGFPAKDEEDWKYTDLAPLASQSFDTIDAPSASPEIASHLLEGCDHLVFVDGHLDRTLSTLDAELTHRSAWPTPTDAFEHDALFSLNQAFALEGAVLRLPPNRRRERPLHVLLVTTAAAAQRMTHLSHVLQLEPGSSAQVLIEHLGLSDAPHFSTHSLYVRVMQNAHLNLTRLQREGTGTTQLFRCDALVERDASLVANTTDLGGALVRCDWSVNLAAPNANVTLDGLYAPKGTAHIDNHTRVDHYWPHGTSREFFRGLASDSARAVFNGKIVVHPQAQKTDSEQRVGNLILSPKAEINAKPELEIYADDVKCAHGATFGQLDPAALFYLRSRGLPLDQAAALLRLAFAQEPVKRITHEGFRHHVAGHVARHLGAEPDL